MYRSIGAHRIATVLRCLILGIAPTALLVFSDGSRSGVREGVQLCLSVLVPSLFPFMALCHLFVKSGLCQTLGKRLEKPTQLLFGLSGTAAPVILLSLIGGYPVGAGGVAALRRQGALSEAQAKRAALFAVCAGPGFTVSFVGGAVYGNTAVGGVILTAQVTSVLLLGMTTRLLYRKQDNDNSIKEIRIVKSPFDTVLVGSVTEAARGMAVICAFVLLFSSLTGVLHQALPDAGLLTTADLLLEVCAGVTRAAKTMPVAAIAFAVGFGGVCVHCQIFAALGELRVNKLLYFLFRILQGAVTAALTQLGLRLLPQKAAVFSTVQAETPAFGAGSLCAGAALLGVAVCFLIAVNQHINREGSLCAESQDGRKKTARWRSGSKR